MTTTGDELLLLGLLDREAMHGYLLNEFLAHRLGFVSNLKRPTAYRLLERLLGEGLVERASERAGRRPERRVYRITAAGRARLDALLRAQLADPQLPVYPGNVAILFWERLAPGERRALLTARHAAVAERRAEVLAMRDAHAAGHPARYALDHDLAHLDAELAWLERVLDELANG